MIKVFFMEIEDSPFSGKDRLLLDFVSEKRRDAVMRYKFDIDKKLSLYAALLTRFAVCSFIHKSNSELFFKESAYKKPALAEPVSSIDFNFSHTKNAILLGITDEGMIGADIERLDKNAPLDIMHMVFHHDEIAYINDSLFEKALHFFECWTRKEAYTKMSGLGLSAEITNINTLAEPVSKYIITKQINGYICSVSVQSEKASSTDNYIQNNTEFINLDPSVLYRFFDV